ncbi:MAG: hypothetical protein WCF04_00190 [Candidatus Nanopelagicales bacterium]
MTTCVLRHRQPTPASHGLLCHGHSLAILDQLADLATWWARLDDVATPGSVDTAGARAARCDPPAPIRLEVVALRDRRTTARADGDPLPILVIVEAWARAVREDRGLTASTTPAALTEELTLLRIHHHWIVGQPWVDDYAAELRACHHQLATIVGEHGPATIAPCPLDQPDGQPCTGRLQQDRWGGMGVTCNRCGAHWDDAQLRHLGRMLA